MAAAKFAATKASTAKTTAREPSTVGLGSSNADWGGEGDSNDGCRQQQFATHGIDPLFHITGAS